MQRNRLDNLLILLEKQPDDPFLIYAIALEYESGDEDDTAWIFFEKLLGQHPDYLPVYYQATMFVLKNGNTSKAVELLLKGMELAQTLKETKTYNELKMLFEELEEES